MSLPFAQTALRTALSSMRASPVTSLVAVATIGLCLLLIGAFVLLVANMERLLDHFGEEIRVSVYLSEETDIEAQQQLAARARIAPGVLEVELLTREAALERFRQHQPEHATLFEGFGESPLPASLEILLAPEQRNEQGVAILVESLSGLPGIGELGYGHEWVSGYAHVVSLLYGAAVALCCVLLPATFLIVAGTIRLSLYARRDEIEIVRLIGGSRGFVASPLLLEGITCGACGGLLGLVLLYLCYRLLLPAFEGGLSLLIGTAEPVFLGIGAACGLIAAGALLGLLGATIALLQDELRS